MSKKKIIIFSILLCLAIIATFYFLGCHKNDFTDDINLNGINEQQSTVKQKPSDGSTPADHSPADNFAYALYDLLEAGSFVSESSGQTVSLGVEQNVKAVRYVNGDEVLKRSLSHSTFKSVGVEMFVSGKNYVLRDATSLKSVDEVTWGADPYRVTEETFISKFGGVPNGITAYVLTENTILSSEFLGEENGIYAYRYILDNALATTKIRLEMRTMAGTKTLPNFEEVALTVYMDGNWRIQKTETACVYKVDMLGGVTCKESLTEVFSAIGEGKEIPDADIFRPYLDAEITEDDGEFTPDAMYYLTNGFNEYMTGTPLNLSLEIKGAVKAVGSASVNIDANDLANIRARVLLDELAVGDIKLNDLFVGYGAGSVYAGLGEFKFKTTVEELVGFIDKIMPVISEDSVSISDLLSFNPDSLLTNATLKRENGIALVTLPLELGSLDADIEIEFSDGETPSFNGIYACVNGLEVFVKPVDEVSLPEINEDFISIAPLFDIIDENYNICLKTRLGDSDAVLKFNLKTMTLDAAYGDLLVKFSDDVLYLEYGDLKAKALVKDLPELIKKFEPLFVNEDGTYKSGFLSNIASAMSGLDVNSLIKELVDNLSVTKTDAGVKIATAVKGASVGINLAAGENGYNLFSLSLSYGDYSIDAVPASIDDISAIPDDELADFKNILSLADIIDENYEINLTASLSAGNISLTADVCINLRTLTLSAKTSLYGSDLYVRYHDGTVYASFKGLDVYADADEIQSLLDRLAPLFGEGLSLDGLSNLSLDLSSVLSSLAFTKTENGLNASLSLSGLNVSANLIEEGDNLKLGQISVSSDGLSLTATPSVKADYSVIDNVDKFYNIISLADIIDENYEINLTASLSAGNISLTADVCINLRTLTLSAKTSLYGSDLYVRYHDGTVYASFKGLDVYADADEIQSLLDRLAPLFGEGLSLDGLSNLSLDLSSVLSSLAFTKTENGLNASLSLSGLNVSANLIEEGDNLKLGQISVSSDGLSLTATPSVKADYSVIDNANKFYNIISIADIIDKDGNINLNATAAGTDIAITFNLYSMRLNAAVEGLAVTLDLKTNTVYAAYGGARVKLNLSDAKSILEKISPIIEKFDKEGKITELLNGFVGEDSFNIDANDIISSLIVTESDGSLSLSLNLAGVDIEAIFATDNGGLTFSSAIINASGTTISAYPSGTVTSDLDTSLYYMDLKAFSDTYADALSGLVTAENIILGINGSVITNGAVYTITNGELVVGGIGSACKISADITFVKAVTDANGNVTEKTNSLRFVYDIDAQKGYFNFNGIEGTFSTVNYNETLEALKQIYNNIPELQELISGIIPLPEDGQFHLPEFDFSKIINSLVLSDSGVLDVDINAKSIIEDLPESIKLSLSCDGNGALSLNISELTLGETSINLTATAAKANSEEIEGKFDYTVGENASDFSSVNTLLKTLSTTSAYRHYELDGTLNLAFLGFIPVDDKVKLNIKIDIIDGVTYVVATLTREHVAAANFAGLYPWSDYSGTSTLYYDGETKMIYIYTDHIKSKNILGVVYKNGSEKLYEKYTEEEFSANMMEILLGMLRLSSKYKDMMGNTNINTSEISIEDIFKKYSYNGTDKFTITLNMSKLTDESINDVTLDLNHDADYNLSSLNVSTTIGGFLELKFNATHVAPFNHENGTKEQVKLQPTLTDGNGNPLY